MASVTARLAGGGAERIDAAMAGEVYAAIGAACGWHEGIGAEIAPETPIGDIPRRAGSDSGRWLAWPSREAMEGPDGTGDAGGAAVAEITID